MSDQIINQKCSSCKEIKRLDQFFKKRTGTRGHDCYCKICRNMINKKYRKTEKGQRMLKLYQQSDKGKRVQKRYQQSEKGKVTNSKAQKRYNQTEKGKKIIGIRVKLYHKTNPEQYKAHKAVNHAIRDRKLPRIDSLQCSCGKLAKQYHHHKGYAPEHWLDVIPLCKKCHVDIHH